MEHKYSIDNSRLVITEITSGRRTWEGKPDNFNVEKILPLEMFDDCLVLLSCDQGPFERSNLIRINSIGSIIWWADFPEPIFPDLPIKWDCYIHVSKGDKGIIEAETFPGQLAYVDIETGKVIDTEFVK